MRKFLLLTAMLATTSAGAGEVADQLMQPGILANVPEQELPEYEHQREISTKEPSDEQISAQVIPLKEVTDGSVKLTEGSGGSEGRLQLSLSDDGRYRVAAEFSSGSSNPILLFFLENVVRAVASQTGGSPFYIRNRIREALVGAEAKDGQSEYTQVTLQPFAEDQNAAHLGNFVNLTITLKYDPAKPYRLLSLLANTGTGEDNYNEAMTLTGEK